MTPKLLLAVTLLALPALSRAETADTQQLKPLTDVRISMQRMLRSSEGRYFLSLYAGVWNPHASLYDLVEQSETKLKGRQKADQLTLKSVDADGVENGQYQLTGTLNSNTGQLKALLLAANRPVQQSVDFEPAIKVSNKPNFIFKFYGAEKINQPDSAALKKIDIINKDNNTVTQSLVGFNAFAKSIGYMDINFDGYYDIILSDISQARTIKDKHYIYWIYNPKTQYFQRSPQLENIVGFPNLHGEKQQIDFGDGQLYKVENGLLNRMN